jgi:hypothetical protein
LLKQEDRLNSWKEISTYIGRDVVTCMKWSSKLELPVYRVDKNSSRSRVFAYKSEIEMWFKERSKIK